MILKTSTSKEISGGSFGQLRNAPAAEAIFKIASEAIDHGLKDPYKKRGIIRRPFAAR
jgi:hypothetical protein